MRTMPMLAEGELFVTLIDGGRPAFWEIRDGRPVMMSYAVTAAGREQPEPAIRCPVTFEHWAECSLEAGHDGEHRGYVSHDLSRAYVVIPDPDHTDGSQ